MFRDMRRKKQQLAEAEAIAMLQSATSGVLAVNGDNGYPYTVPVSHVYEDGRLYFHSAVEGHKVEALRRDDRVSFCVIVADEVRPPELTTYYRSVVVFGRARILEDTAEKQHALECLARRFSADHMEYARKSIREDWDRLVVVEVRVEHVTAKAALELLKAK